MRARRAPDVVTGVVQPLRDRDGKLSLREGGAVVVEVWLRCGRCVAIVAKAWERDVEGEG